MKPAPFAYYRPEKLEEAVRLLAEFAPQDGRVLAGGQSLVPMMNFRLARPALQGLSPQWPGAVSHDDAQAERVHQALPAACSAERVPSHPSPNNPAGGRTVRRIAIGVVQEHRRILQRGIVEQVGLGRGIRWRLAEKDQA